MKTIYVEVMDDSVKISNLKLNLRVKIIEQKTTGWFQGRVAHFLSHIPVFLQSGVHLHVNNMA